MTQEWRIIMKLKDTGLTAQDIKDRVSKYMIETYERFDFLAETASRHIDYFTVSFFIFLV